MSLKGIRRPAGWPGNLPPGFPRRVNMSRPRRYQRCWGSWPPLNAYYPGCTVRAAPAPSLGALSPGDRGRPHQRGARTEDCQKILLLACYLDSPPTRGVTSRAERLCDLELGRQKLEDTRQTGRDCHAARRRLTRQRPPADVREASIAARRQGSSSTCFTRPGWESRAQGQPRPGQSGRQATGRGACENEQRRPGKRQTRATWSSARSAPTGRSCAPCSSQP